MSSIKGEIVRAQGRILDALVDLENRMAALYDKFSVAFPLLAEFWTKIAREERGHAKTLEGLHFVLARGFIFHDIGRFNQERMKPVLEIIEAADRKVAAARMDVLESLTVALKLECSLVESRFYTEVSSDAPEFSAGCKVLQSETERHVALLRAMIDKENGGAASDPWAKNV